MGDFRIRKIFVHKFYKKIRTRVHKLYTTSFFLGSIVYKCEDRFCTRSVFFLKASCTSVKIDYVHEQYFFGNIVDRCCPRPAFFRRIVDKFENGFCPRAVFFWKHRGQVLSTLRKKSKSCGQIWMGVPRISSRFTKKRNVLLFISDGLSIFPRLS